MIDFSTLSEFERAELERIASNTYYDRDSFDTKLHQELSLDDFILPEDIVWFFLLLEGERPATEIGGIYISQDLWSLESDPFEELLFSLNLSYFTQTAYLPEDRDDYDAEMQYIKNYIVIDTDDLETDHKQIMDLYYTDVESYGEIFGYPQWAIDAFDSENGLNNHSPVEYAVNELKIPKEEVAYLNLVPFTIKDDEEQIRKVISIGKEYERKSRGIADEYEIFTGLHWWVDEALSDGLKKAEIAIEDG